MYSNNIRKRILKTLSVKSKKNFFNYNVLFYFYLITITSPFTLKKDSLILNN